MEIVYPSIPLPSSASPPFLSFPPLPIPPLSHCRLLFVPKPLIQLESLGSVVNSHGGSARNPAVKRIVVHSGVKEHILLYNT